MIYAGQMTVGSVIPLGDGTVWEVTKVQQPRPNIVRFTLVHEWFGELVQDFSVDCLLDEMQLIMERKFQ